MTIPATFQLACLQILVLYFGPILIIRIWSTVLSILTRRAWSIFVVTGIVGVPIHEASHLLGCWLFGLKPTRVVFFRPDRSSGTLGYVNFRYRPHSVFAHFGLFIQGIAPLVTGTVIVVLCLSSASGQAFTPSSLSVYDAQESLVSFAMFLFDAIPATLCKAQLGLSSITGVLTVGFASCVSLHAIPSWSDIRIGLRGAVVLTVLTLISFIFIGVLTEVTGFTPYSNVYDELELMTLQAGGWLTRLLMFALYGVVTTITLAILTMIAISLIAILLKIFGLQRRSQPVNNVDDTESPSV